MLIYVNTALLEGIDSSTMSGPFPCTGSHAALSSATETLCVQRRMRSNREISSAVEVHILLLVAGEIMLVQCGIAKSTPSGSASIAADGWRDDACSVWNKKNLLAVELHRLLLAARESEIMRIQHRTMGPSALWACGLVELQ